MSITFNGTSQYVSAATAPATAYPLSFFCYYNPTVSNVAMYQMALDNSASAVINGWKIRAAGDVGGPPQRMSTGDGTSNSAVSTSTNFSAATWQKAYAVLTNATSRSIYLNNAGLGTDAVSLTPTGINRSIIGALGLQAVISSWFNGSLAHVAIWNAALGATDRAMLQAGLSPKLVLQNNLVAYLPFWDSTFAVTDLFGATSWAAQNSPTYSADPGVKYNNNMMTMGMS